jgi:hypothetical protein
MKTYETPATLSQAVANLEDELAYYKEQLAVLDRFKGFTISSVARAAKIMVDDHLRQYVETFRSTTTKMIYEDAGFDIDSTAFNDAVLWSVMNWSSRDRKGEEDMIEYVMDKMLEFYPDLVTTNYDEQSTLRRQLSVSLNHAYKVAKLIDSY